MPGHLTIRAIRVRKARHPGWCPLGSHPFLTGTSLGQLPAGPWACIRCITTRNQENTMTQPEPLSHWQPPPPAPEGPACRPALLRKPPQPFMLTILRRDVTCEACRQTPAWQTRNTTPGGMS